MISLKIKEFTKFYF